MKNLKHLERFKGNPKKMQGGFWAAAAVITSVVGVVDASNKAAGAAAERAAAERDAIAAQERAANVRAQKERIKQQREARIARARIISSATSAGVGTGSSGVAGATGSITSQMGSNIGDINVAQTFATAAAEANKRASSAASDVAGFQAQAAQWQALGVVSNSIFQQQGGWNSIFSDEIEQAKASGAMSPDEFMNPTQYTFGK